MNAVANQRWRDGRAAYRPAGEPIAHRAYEVAEIAGDKIARAFVERHHYSGSYPAARLRVGLYRSGDLVGVAVFSHPPSEKVLARLPCERLAGVELGRFVLLDEVPGNGESWFLARCFRHLRAHGFEALISHSDPVPRSTASGVVVMPGHVGTIYQATNAVYGGRTKPTLLALLPDGSVFSPRCMSKIRRREVGHRYAIAKLVAAGAPPPLPGADLAAWMRASISAVCRRVRHGGNHRYLWAIDRRLAREVSKLASGEPYPKARTA